MLAQPKPFPSGRLIPFLCLAVVLACSSDDFSSGGLLSPAHGGSGRLAAAAAVNGPIVFVGPSGIEAVNPDGTNRHTLAAGGDQPSVSYSGARIVFHKNGDIWIMDADGSNQAALTSGPDEDSQPAWSPGGGRIAFRRREAGDTSGHIWLMNSDGSGLEQVTDGPVNGLPDDSHPTWKQEEDWLAFARQLTAENSDLFILCINPVCAGIPSALQNHTNTLGNGENETDPASAGSSATQFYPFNVLYTCEDPARNTGLDICIKGSLGNEIVLVGTPEDETEPAWSPDGISFTFVRGSQLYRTSVEVVAPVAVPNTSGASDPSWGTSAPPVCSDGLDNDGDGQTDFPFDPGCDDASDSSEADAPPLAQCADGIDNDGDGFIDTEDPQCTSPDDDNESNPTPQCSDGIDNDGDTKVDRLDPGCRSNQDDDEHNDRVTQCSDGRDNDRDGKTDFPADLGCGSPVDDLEDGETPPKGLTQLFCSFRGMSQGVVVQFRGGQTTITGTPRSDVIVGTNLHDTIEGLGGNDLICGFGGSDQIRGGPGNDVIYGGDGEDVIVGDGGSDRLFGEGGDDYLAGQAFTESGKTDVCIGGAGNDTLDGDSCDVKVP